MASFLAGLGRIAGGAAEGYNEAEELRIKREEADARKEERERKKNLDAALKSINEQTQTTTKQGDFDYGNTDAWDGGDVPVAQKDIYAFGGQTADKPFSDDDQKGIKLRQSANAYRAANRPEIAEQIETGAIAREHARLGIKRLTREEQQHERTNEVLQRYHEIQRDLISADPEKVGKALANFSKVHNNSQFGGNGFSSVTPNEDGTFNIVMADPTKQQSQVHKYDPRNPANAQQIQDLVQQAMVYELNTTSSENAYRGATHQLAKRTADSTIQHHRATEATGLMNAQTSARTAATTEAWRGDTSQLARDEFNAKQRGGMYTRPPSGVGTYTPSFTQAGTLADNTPIVFDNRTGTYKDGITGQPLTDKQMKLFQKVTGTKPEKTGIQPVAGNPGMFTDGVTLYEQGPNGLKEIPTPRSLKELGETITKNLPPQGGAPRSEGLRVPGSRAPIESSEIIRNPNEWKIDLTSGGDSAVTGAANMFRGKTYRHLLTGERISEQEFIRRTPQ